MAAEAEAEVVASDVVEQILVRMEAKDLIRCKSVCKSWLSLMSTPLFVKTHLNSIITYNNNNSVGHRKIVMVKTSINMSVNDSRLWYKDGKWDYQTIWEIVGSSNGLVCVSPVNEDDYRIYVANPLIREVRKLPTAPSLPENVMFALCLSFGYDSSADDYKVVMGIRKGLEGTLIRIFSLKSNSWKLFGHVKYRFYNSNPGILFNGALYWFVFDANIKTYKKPLIISFDLSKEEFEEIPQPDGVSYIWSENGSRLGIIQQGLCIFSTYDLPTGIWVMKNDNNQQLSWELLPNDFEIKDDVAHSLNMFKDRISPEKIKRVFFCDGNICSSTTGEYLGDPIFVQTLVSPYVNRRPDHTNNNKRRHVIPEVNESVGATESKSKKRRAR